MGTVEPGKVAELVLLAARSAESMVEREVFRQTRVWRDY